MIYQVRHRSLLTYAAPVAHAQFNLRLRPVDWPGQTLRHFAMNFTPPPADLVESQGPYPVNTAKASFTRPLVRLEVVCDMEIAVETGRNPGSGPLVGDVRSAALVSRDLSNRSPVPYLFASRIASGDAEIGHWAADHLPMEGGIVESVATLTRAIHDLFAYKPGTTTSTTPPGVAFRQRKGVCQDFAHVMIIALRAHGIPAAYVSGYLRTRPPPGRERLVGADAMHAWVAVWCGEALGWIGFDPTNDCLARGDHIVVAMGRDYADVAPVDGVFIGASLQKITSAVDVVPID